MARSLNQSNDSGGLEIDYLQSFEFLGEDKRKLADGDDKPKVVKPRKQKQKVEEKEKTSITDEYSMVIGIGIAVLILVLFKIL